MAMMPNLRHLQVFREVASRRSISAASQAVHLSQPAITQAMASVEKYFGTPLFKRSHVGMHLTPAGEICLARIERAIEHLDAGVEEISRPVQRAKSLVARPMTVAQLQTLVAVVEEGGFSVAARACGVSQPSIHRAARELEHTLGVSLFEKTSFGIQATRAAQHLSRRARLAFAEIQQACVEVATLRGGEAGSTVIGAMPLARSFLVPMTLIRFCREYPTHRIAIMEGTYEDLLDALRNGQADFLVGAMRESMLHDDTVQQHLFDDPLAIVMRANHPLARHKKVTAQSLARYPWIAPRTDSPLHGHFTRLFQKSNTAPVCTIECNSLAAARALLLESDRLVLLSAHQIHYELRAGLLTTLPHPNGHVTRSIGLTLRRDWHPTRAQQRLLELLRKQTRTLQAAQGGGVATKSKSQVPGSPPRRDAPARRKRIS